MDLSGLPPLVMLVPAVAAGLLGYGIGKLRGFNEGVVHGRASQGAVNRIAEEFDYVLEEPGVIMVDGEEFVKALMQAQIKAEAERTDGEDHG